MRKDDLSRVFIALRASLARSVRGIVPPKEIEDIVQETYVRACQANHRERISSPRSFLYKTARNLALDHIKRAETRLTTSPDDDQIGECELHGNLADETLEQVSSDEEFVLFCDAVRRLPTQIRRAFVLKKVYGYSQREIAKELGLSESTVEKHVAQGIKRCRYFMMRRANDAGRKHARSDGNCSARTTIGKDDHS